MAAEAEKKPGSFVQRTVKVYEGATKQVFESEIYPLREPAVLRGVDLGVAVERWQSVGYLAERGGEVPVRVHVCDPSGRMDFINRNFAYK